MRHYIRPRRPAVRATQEPVIRVERATYIPTGMHGVQETQRFWRSADLIPTGMHAAQFLDKRRILEDVVERLIARGVDPVRARILTNRAAWRRQNNGGGLGDDEVGPQMPPDIAAAQRLEAITADARKVQSAHQNMIKTMAGWTERTPDWVTNDDNLRLTFVNQLTDLKDQFIHRSLPILGVEFPYQIERTDPAGAVVIAVRDDIMGTIDLLDARKAQQLLQRQIAELPKPGGGLNIQFPNIDVPWYVWAGAAAVGGAVVTKALHLW
jgi:hypothetical protein